MGQRKQRTTYISRPAPNRLRAEGMETVPEQEIECRIRNFRLNLRKMDLGTASPNGNVVTVD